MRFSERAARVRRAGIRQAFLMRWFFLTVGLVSAVGTALVFWVGGMLVLQGTFTIGTIVAFTAYLGMLYGPLSVADQRPGRFRHVDGQLRAGVRGARPACGDRGAGGRPAT